MEKICRKIVELPENADLDLVEVSLNPIIEKEIKKKEIETKQRNDDDGSNPKTGTTRNSSCISPLMVACDKSQIPCLQYFTDKLGKYNEDENVSLLELESLLGRPLDVVSTDHNNQAVHYGAMSRCAECVMYLAKILLAYKNATTINMNSKSRNSRSKNMEIDVHDDDSKDHSLFQAMITILSQKNSNGDTALMMTSFLGEYQMLEMWFDQLLTLAKKENIPFQQCIRQIRNVIRLENKGGDCCLSLSYGHGYSDVVNCLIQERQNWEESKLHEMEALVIVSYKDVEKAKAVIKKVNTLSSSIMNEGCTSMTSEQIQIVKQKIQNTRRCLIMLQVSLAKLVDKKSNELLDSERKEKNEMKTKCKRKEKALQKEVKGYADVHTKKKITSAISESSSKSTSVETERENFDSSIPFFETLDDGTIVSPNKKQEHNDNIRQQEEEIHKENHHTIQSMLRDRCLQSTFVNTNDSTIVTSEAIMESLCLDASMLLLSSHGMAMELSPSQLDVIEKVLYQQINAVEEARKIHQRLMSQMKGENNETTP